MSEVPEYSTKEYWENRTKRGIEANNLRDMIFDDPRFGEYEKRVREQLSLWTKYNVLDLASGYGRYSTQFNRYHGVDFSEEMIKLANEMYGNKSFEVADIKGYTPKEMYDVIFEVNSLHSLQMTPEQFYEQFKDHARVAIACLEADQFTIFEIYRR